MEIYTIGFTKKTAAEFFGSLRQTGIRRLIDIRLNNSSQFLALMQERKIEEKLDRRSFEIPTVLLCSEATAERCHRRLVSEYLQAKWGDLIITHL
ncbi:MAG: DUF488 family protein [Ktedonobacteraceae bacterium]